LAAGPAALCGSPEKVEQGVSGKEAVITLSRREGAKLADLQ
jgi:hypothetical protein